MSAERLAHEHTMKELPMEMPEFLDHLTDAITHDDTFDRQGVHCKPAPATYAYTEPNQVIVTLDDGSEFHVEVVKAR